MGKCQRLPVVHRKSVHLLPGHTVGVYIPTVFGVRRGLVTVMPSKTEYAQKGLVPHSGQNIGVFSLLTNHLWLLIRDLDVHILKWQSQEIYPRITLGKQAAL